MAVHLCEDACGGVDAGGAAASAAAPIGPTASSTTAAGGDPNVPWKATSGTPTRGHFVWPRVAIPSSALLEGSQTVHACCAQLGSHARALCRHGLVTARGMHSLAEGRYSPASRTRSPHESGKAGHPPTPGDVGRRRKLFVRGCGCVTNPPATASASQTAGRRGSGYLSEGTRGHVRVLSGGMHPGGS